MMRTALRVLLLLSVGWLRVMAQHIEVSGSKIDLPEGNVLGAAFYEEKGTFFVQQSVLSTENGGLVIRFHRQLSSWNIKSRSMIATRSFDMAPAGASAFPCARIEVSAKSNRILTCSAEAYLEIIDPDTLNTVGKIAYRDDQYINDFAVDDLRSRVFVLSSQRDRSIRLTAYSMPDGRQLQEASLPTTPNTMRRSLALASKTGQVGVAMDGGGHSGDKSDIYICGSDTTFSCTNIAQINTVLQIDFLGGQIVAATNSFADNKKDCVLTIDPTTRSVSRAYCAPATGVHYAVGVVDKEYVVAFTGVSKRKIFREENTSVASSFSVWRVENPQVAAVAKDPTDYGAFQNEIGVVASSTEPLFFAYQRVSNMLCLYSITESR